MHGASHCQNSYNFIPKTVPSLAIMTESATDELNSSSHIIKKALSCEVEPRSHRWFDGFLRCLKPIWVAAGKSSVHELKESKF